MSTTPLKAPQQPAIPDKAQDAVPDADTAPHADTVPALKHLFTRLQARPWLPAPLLHLARQITALQQQHARQLATQPAPSIDPALLAEAEAHRQGKPLLEPQHFPYDAAGAARLWQALLDLVDPPQAALTDMVDPPQAAHQGAEPEAPPEAQPMQKAAQAVRRAMQGQPEQPEQPELAERAELAAQPERAAQPEQAELALRPQDAFAAFVQNDTAFFDRWAARMPEAPAMLRFLAQASLTPWLHAATLALAKNAPSPANPASPADPASSPSTASPADPASHKVWEYGSCPHCGHVPYMGQLRGKEGARWHVCSFCQLSYRAARLQCPVCLERDTAKLHFFATADAPGYEVHVCESCKNYMKLADWREKDLAQCVDGVAALEDLDSLPLDLAARQQGYVRNTLSAWGF